MQLERGLSGFYDVGKLLAQGVDVGSGHIECALFEVRPGSLNQLAGLLFLVIAAACQKQYCGNNHDRLVHICLEIHKECQTEREVVHLLGLLIFHGIQIE